MAHSAQLLLKYSLLDQLQLQLGSNNVFLAGSGLTARAFDGVIPGIKVRLNSQSTWLPTTSLSVHASLPTSGFAEAAQKTIDLSAWWYASKDFGRLHADLNVSMSVYDVTHPVPQGLTALSVSYSFGHGWGVFSELYSTFGNAQAVPLDGGSLNGLNFSPIDEVTFDLGADVGFYRGTRVFTAFAGVTFVPFARRASPVARLPRTPAGAIASRPQ
ncbi:MAG: hypothetical protein K1X89_20790 [Myxococcaceae bacterium]|nr:hypothetical protein [Myxococcaceae bacterium]